MESADSYDSASIGGIIHRLVPHARLVELLRIEALAKQDVVPPFEPRAGESPKQFLERARRDLGLHQKDIPLSQGYISKIENGERPKLRPTTMKKLVDYFTERAASMAKDGTHPPRSQGQ